MKELGVHGLPALSREIRDFLVESVSKTGGHLGSSLGAVELSVAVHYVYSSPVDKIVWDTGHQAYVHKILTGRSSQFSTLRKENGLCGFLRRDESEHDQFGAGHASTSISAALGMAVARDLRGEKHKVVAIIGDGALTAGLALEGLNNAGILKRDLLVILNDNNFSISPNVGAISQYLNRLASSPNYVKTKVRLKDFLRKNFGITITKAAHEIEERLRTLVTPGILFEELGFRYFGPIDGHDVVELVRVLENLKEIPGPKLLHVLTKKGKGYQFAEVDGERLHGVTPFDVQTGMQQPTPPQAITYTKAFSSLLIRLARLDSRIVAITAAMPNGTGLVSFAKEFPTRFFDVGIAEQHAVTFAAGMATQGFKPVCAIYSTFLQRAYDQIIHDVCVQNLNVVFAIDRGGLVGADGETHQGVFDLSYLRMIPRMVVMAPKDENELGHMMYTAFRYDGGPIAIRYPRGSGLGVALDQTLFELPLGKAEVVRRGEDIMLVGIGTVVDLCMKAADVLATHDIFACVVNARFVKPLDPQFLRWGKKFSVLTVEENVVAGGFGAGLAEFLASHGVYPKISHIGVPDRFIAHGSQKWQLSDCGITVEKIVEKARELVRK